MRAFVPALLVALGCQAFAADITVDPNATFLRTNADTANAARPIVLADLGIQSGDEVTIAALGDFNFGSIDEDVSSSLIAVFSSSGELLADSELNRVVGAIDAGEDFITAPTLIGELLTDIPEDFLVDRPLTLNVPDAASHLFVSAVDSSFGDNRDLNADFAVRITATQVVPEPSVYQAVAWAAAAVLLLHRRRRSLT